LTNARVDPKLHRSVGTIMGRFVYPYSDLRWDDPHTGVGGANDGWSVVGAACSGVYRLVFFTVSATTPRTGIVTTHMFHHSNKIVQL